MSTSRKQLSINRETAGIWRVTFNHPPINLIDHDTLHELHDLVSALEAADELKVVIFDSADPDFFLAHWDIASVARPSPTGAPQPSWTDISLRLAQAPVVTIGLIRGRARGMGSEIALGLDLRFASIERAIFGQPEVGVGLVPGGGAMERLSMLAGRARGLEIVLGADDFDASMAERYGWINRALPAAALGDFVKALAHRIGGFPASGHVAVKNRVNSIALAPAEDFRRDSNMFGEGNREPAAQERTRAAMKRGFQTREGEKALAKLLGALAER